MGDNVGDSADTRPAPIVAAGYLEQYFNACTPGPMHPGGVPDRGTTMPGTPTGTSTLGSDYVGLRRRGRVRCSPPPTGVVTGGWDRGHPLLATFFAYRGASSSRMPVPFSACKHFSNDEDGGVKVELGGTIETEAVHRRAPVAVDTPDDGAPVVVPDSRGP